MGNMKPKTRDEYATFSGALRKVLQVSHSEIKARLDADKKKRKPKRASASHASERKD